MQNGSIYTQMTRSEREVAEFLKKLNIRWCYEKPVFVWDENRRPGVWAPDFYLITFGIYIEVCGSEKFDYEYRRNIYDNNGYGVIFLHLYKETIKWKEYLMDHLKRITNYRSKKLNEITSKVSFLFVKKWIGV